MNIHPDAIVVIAMAFGFLMGYIFGRIEREDSYIRGYKRGKIVAEAIARNNAVASVDMDYQVWLKNER